MKRKALFIITGNPSSHSRPAEAIRIAAGIQAWEKIVVRLYLHHPAAQALLDPSAELLHEPQLHQCLATLATAHQPVYIPVGLDASPRGTLDASHLQELTDPELASLAAQSDCVLYF